MDLTSPRPVVFTAQSKNYFYCRDAVCAYVLAQGYIPLNPFRVFDYFLSDRVDRDLIRRANFNLIRVCDELWVFGETIANGVFAEIKYALDLDKPMRLFTIAAHPDLIQPLSGDEVDRLTLESELEAHLPAQDFQNQIQLMRQQLHQHSLPALHASNR